MSYTPSSHPVVEMLIIVAWPEAFVLALPSSYVPATPVAGFRSRENVTGCPLTQPAVGLESKPAGLNALPRVTIWSPLYSMVVAVWTCQANESGVLSTFPALSTARTWNVCAPTPMPVYVFVLVHVVN